MFFKATHVQCTKCPSSTQPLFFVQYARPCTPDLDRIIFGTPAWFSPHSQSTAKWSPQLRSVRSGHRKWGSSLHSFFCPGDSCRPFLAQYASCCCSTQVSRARSLSRKRLLATERRCSNGSNGLEHPDHHDFNSLYISIHGWSPAAQRHPGSVKRDVARSPF